MENKYDLVEWYTKLVGYYESLRLAKAVDDENGNTIEQDRVIANAKEDGIYLTVGDENDVD